MQEDSDEVDSSKIVYASDENDENIVDIKFAGEMEIFHREVHATINNDDWLAKINHALKITVIGLRIIT